MIEIYLAITQKQVLNFETLISDSDIMVESNTYKLLIRDGSFNYNRELWDEVITSEILLQYKSNSRVDNFVYMCKKIKAYKTIIKQLKKHNNSKEIRVFVCYIEDVLSNFLFFNFKAEFIVVEDGILNYYNHTYSNVNKLRFMLKKVIAILYGIPFKRYKGHSSGVEYNKVIKQFLTFPQAAFIPQKACQLPIKKKSITEINKGLFLIGQETYLELLTRDQYKHNFYKLLNSIHCEIQEKGIKKVFYKPRYKIIPFEKKALISVFGKENLTIIFSELSSEEFYFKHLNCSHIASFNSSTSINIYAQLLDYQKKNITFYYYSIIQSEVNFLFESLGFNRLN